MDTPPSLPPRPPKKSSYLNPYSYRTGSSTWSSRAGLALDPRSSSTSSLRPIQSLDAETPRRLLIIYIHGFLGSEESFGSFPAHLHYPLTAKLVASHVVHSKIYPRYRSRRPIAVASDEFSNWLQPHEDNRTDIILIGHSMGGILAAEVTLLHPISRNSNEALRHHILGIVAIDVPFLGVSPRVVGTVLASLFRSNPAVPEWGPADGEVSRASSESLAMECPTASGILPSISGPPSPDPNFDPAYPNDKRLVERTRWQKVSYFIQKHSDRLVEATTQYFVSHLQFGGCLADYPRLKRRYERLRALEDVDELRRPEVKNGRLQKRVRFVNYYSTTTGRAKAQRSPSPQVVLPASEETNIGSKSDKNQLHADDARENLSQNLRASKTPAFSDIQSDQEDPERGRHKGKMKDRKFCTLPAKDAFGNRDRTWVPIHMEGVDEVMAHTSLFRASNAYKVLVDDVISRIESWVHEDQTSSLLQQEIDVDNAASPVMNSGA